MASNTLPRHFFIAPAENHLGCASPPAAKPCGPRHHRPTTSANAQTTHPATNGAPATAKRRKARRPTAHHETPPVRVGKRAPQKREDRGRQGRRGRARRARTAPTRAAVGHRGAVETRARRPSDTSPSVQPYPRSTQAQRRDAPAAHEGPARCRRARHPRCIGLPIALAHPHSATPSSAQRTPCQVGKAPCAATVHAGPARCDVGKHPRRAKAQPDAAALRSDTSACRRNSAKPHTAHLPSPCSLTHMQADQPHEIYQATVEGAEIYAMEAVRMPQKYAGKEARGSRRRPWALIGAASIGLTLGNDGISKWNEGGQPYPRRKKREYWRAASGAGRRWRARGSSGEAADGALQAWLQVREGAAAAAMAVARVEAHAKGCEIRNEK
ncbi:hypothetical protein BJ912DRAFT_1140857 [Pholiota molesta]|nr:hypothetical protein BJ912DRAFT_1140857 [Pholiota molesta]